MKEIGANEALDQLQNDPDTVYLDVRSVPEFQQGHPIRAINIPILHFLPGMGMMPNEDFAKVVEANLSKETKLVVGCKSGVRSARACEILTQLDTPMYPMSAEVLWVSWTIWGEYWSPDGV